jgi:nucleotide-binding universal stress UspA family protein
MDQNIPKAINILIADDGSEHSQAARQLIYDLPLDESSSITIATVVASDKTANSTYYSVGMDKIAEPFRDKGIEVTTELLIGHPAETIVETAEEKRVDLIVIGAKGLRARLGILLGGVVQQVVEYSQHPVLIVRAPYSGLRLVLAITDGSSHSRSAIRFLSRFPLPKEVEIRLVHVLPPLPSPEIYMHAWPIGAEPLPPMNPIDREEISARQEEEQREGQALLDKSLETLASFGVEAKGVLLRGDAASEIMEYAKSNQADLILAGSRGMSQVKGWFLGSLSRKLVHYSNCSVLIVRGEKEP